MDSFPQLFTSNLNLRKLQVDDVDSLVKYANNKAISDNIINIPYPYREPDGVFRIGYVHQGFKNKTRYVFAIILRERDELIGEISLHLGNDKTVSELGYWIAEPFWGNGYATEAVAVVLKFGFEQLGLEQIFATCYQENEASWKVLVHNRMAHTGIEGRVMSFGLTRKEYDAWIVNLG